jgi:hypothetical protein
VTPPQYQYVIDDWFESITLYDNRATRRRRKPLPTAVRGDDRRLANKRKADELGKETDAPLDDWIDVGVLDADGVPLYPREEARSTSRQRRSPSSSQASPRAPASTRSTC